MITFEKILVLVWHLLRLAVRMLLATVLVLLSPIVQLVFELTGRDPEKFEEAYERWLYDGFRGLFRR